jgi:hypothetical protein
MTFLLGFIGMSLGIYGTGFVLTSLVGHFSKKAINREKKIEMFKRIWHLKQTLNLNDQELIRELVQCREEIDFQNTARKELEEKKSLDVNNAKSLYFILQELKLTDEDVIATFQERMSATSTTPVKEEQT